MTPTEINQVIWSVDPMNTACKENLVFDEYAAEAEQIFNMIGLMRVNSYQAVYDLVKTTFSTFFWVDSVPEQKLKEVADGIYKLVRVCERS
jgi:hypothetical protein